MARGQIENLRCQVRKNKLKIYKIYIHLLKQYLKTAKGQTQGTLSPEQTSAPPPFIYFSEMSRPPLYSGQEYGKCTHSSSSITLFISTIYKDIEPQTLQKLRTN